MTTCIPKHEITSNALQIDDQHHSIAKVAIAIVADVLVLGLYVSYV